MLTRPFKELCNILEKDFQYIASKHIDNKFYTLVSYRKKCTIWQIVGICSEIKKNGISIIDELNGSIYQDTPSIKKMRELFDIKIPLFHVRTMRELEGDISGELEVVHYNIIIETDNHVILMFTGS